MKTNTKTNLSHITISLIAVLILALSLPSPAQAATNTTTPGTLTLVPTAENIGIYSPFSGDDNSNSQAVLEYRAVGTSTWRTGIPMTPDWRQQYSRYDGDAGITRWYDNPFKNQWRAIIISLQPNTDYEVRVTYTDPDGVSGANPISAIVRTLNDNPPSNGTTYYVSPTGSDSSNGLTSTTPFATIRHTQDVVQAGDRVLLMPGTHSAPGRDYPLTATGTLDNYITFESADINNRAIVGGNRLVVSGEFIRFRQLDFAPSDGLQNILLRNCNDVIIEDCTFSLASSGEWNWGGPPGAVVLDNATGILIQRNQIFSDDIRHQKFGIYSLSDNSQAIVIRGNTFIGYGMKDATSGQWFSDIFIHDNYIGDTWDDALEVEGLCVNVAIWGNTTNGGAMGLGMAPVAIGPYYIFRNVFYNFRDAGLKMGNSSTATVYIYHNTIHTPIHVRGIATFGNNALINNIIMRNNIIESGYYVIDSSDSDPAWNYWDIDYDCLVSHDSAGFSKWRVGQVNAQRSFSELQAALNTHPGAGYANESNGISTDPQFVSTASSNYNLESSSPCIDSGITLPGFNDANSPWPYQGAAPDRGAYEYAGGSPTNRPPTLNLIGNKSVTNETQLQFTISATDPDFDTLTYSAFNLPSGATFNPQTRAFSWTPTSSQTGSYSNVRFIVSDGTLTDYENITITVLGGGENQPPVLNTIGYQSVTEGDVLQFIVSATDPNNDPLTFSADNLPPGANFNPLTGVFSWTPTSGQAGNYTNVHFEVSDGELTDFEDITITVSVLPVPSSLPLRVNAAGNEYIDSQSNTWVADQDYATGSWGFYGPDNTIDRGTGHSISGTVNDRIYQTERYGLSGYRFDLENGTYDIILHFSETYSGITGPGQRVFDVSIEGQLMLDNLDIYSEAGYSTALIKVLNGVVVQDNQLNIEFISSIEEPEINGIEIAVAGRNHVPMLSPIGNKSTSEEEPLEFTIMATDLDNDLLTFSADNLPEGATFNPQTKTFSWTPTSSQVGSYPNVHFEVSDGSLTDSEDITIAVLSSDNSAPVLNDIGNKSISEGKLLEFTTSATDPDDDALTFSASNLPPGAVFNPETQTFSWTPDLGRRGSYYFVRFNVTDGALNNYEYITITVTNNDPPILDTIGNKSVREGEALEFTISATDADDDPLTFSADNLPYRASFNMETGEFSWTPNSTQIGIYEKVRFEVSDGAFTDSEDITITVLSIGNNAPALDTIGDKVVNETEPLEFTITATDPDDDPLTFSADNLPEGATFDTETGAFSWTPVLGQADEYIDVHFEVSDGELTVYENIIITVNIPAPLGGGGGGDTGGGGDAGGGGGGGVGGSIPSNNEAPVLDEIGSQSIETGELLEFTLSATDPDDDELTFSTDNLPYGANFDPGTGIFSWTPEPGQEGEHSAVHFEVSDGELTDEEDITITVDSAGETRQDTTPPVIKEVAASNVGTDIAVIRWTTTEPSTSQVEYWASPSQFSPMDETLVTEHEVYLTGLRPGTDYHYRTISQDDAGNLVTSPAYDFTTPTAPATFIVNWLTLSPAEASIGQEITIRTLVTNTGDVAGSYEVVLSVDGVVEATESIADLAGGTSQEVAFAITRDDAGVYTVNVNGTTGTLVINNAEEPETAIELFSITPNYESDTGVITFTSVEYMIYESYYSTLFSQLDAELVLKVGLGDEPLEEVTLIASGQSEPDMSIGNLNYIPAGDWTSDTYTFQAELRTGAGVIETSPPVRLIITPAAAASVASWATLGEIIGGVLIITLLAILLILHRNRDMLRAQSLE